MANYWLEYEASVFSFSGRDDTHIYGLVRRSAFDCQRHDVDLLSKIQKIFSLQTAVTHKESNIN